MRGLPPRGPWALVGLELGEGSSQLGVLLPWAWGGCRNLALGLGAACAQHSCPRRA